MKILVTGANGFAGSHLIQHLTKNMANRVVAVSSTSSVSRLTAKPIPVVWEQCDITDEDSVRHMIAMHRPQQVYHLAGIAVTHGVQHDGYFRNNVIGTYHIGKAVLDICGPSTRLLYVSSSSVYGNAEQFVSELSPLRPNNAYGASKVSAEMSLQILTKYGLDLRIARPFNHTGPGQRAGFVCPDLIGKIRKSIDIAQISNDRPKIQVLSANSVRDFADVRDVVRAYELIMNQAPAGSVYNVATGVGRSIEDICSLLCTDVADPDRVKFDFVTERSSDDQDIIVGENKLIKELGWKPLVPFKTTLLDLWNSMEWHT